MAGKNDGAFFMQLTKSCMLRCEKYVQDHAKSVRFMFKFSNMSSRKLTRERKRERDIYLKEREIYIYIYET